jgi:hypothetical protein
MVKPRWWIDDLLFAIIEGVLAYLAVKLGPHGVGFVIVLVAGILGVACIAVQRHIRRNVRRIRNRRPG